MEDSQRRDAFEAAQIEQFRLMQEHMTTQDANFEAFASYVTESLVSMRNDMEIITYLYPIIVILLCFLILCIFMYDWVYVSARLIFPAASVSFIPYVTCCIYVILLIACFVSF